MRCLLLVFSFCLALFFNKAYCSVDAIKLNVTELSSNPGQVSTEAKQFQLEIEYKVDLFQEEDLVDLSSSNSVFLSRLRIISRSLNKKKKTPKSLLDDYSFSLVEESDAETEGYKKVVYLSNNQVIKKASRINFRIDIDEYLEENFFDSREFVTRAAQKLDILGLELDFDSIVVNQTDLVFTKTNATAIKSKLESGTINVIATLSSEQNLSDIIKRDLFRFTSASGKKIRPKIKADNTRKSTLLTVDNSSEDIDILFLGDNKYEVSIPLNLVSKNKLGINKTTNLFKFDTLVLPISINGKTGDSLDITISGILRQQFNISGEIDG